MRTRWKEPAELKTFCDLCAAQVLDGKRNVGFLRRERGWCSDWVVGWNGKSGDSHAV